MDYHKVLRILTTSDKDDPSDFDERLEKLLDQVFSLLPAETKTQITSECEKAEDITTRRKYLQTILLVLQTLHKDVLSISETFMSVTEYRGVKIAIEMITSLGIIPHLMQGIGIELNKYCLHATNLKEEPISDYKKYGRLVITTRTLTDCYNEISLRPAILTQLGPILGALFQLAHAPLSKPKEGRESSSSSSEFQMTPELYQKLSLDQLEFQERLQKIMENCRQASVIKELMVLSGLQKAPKWLKRKTHDYLTKIIEEPTGIMALINAVCEDSFDIGAHWRTLEVISKLVANIPAIDLEKYQKSICNQMLEILSSKKIKNAAILANYFISALHESHPAICKEKIVDILAAPFLQVSKNNEVKSVIKSETSVSECVENLIKCFICKEAKFKQLPCKLIEETAIPLFVLHVKVYKSPSLLRSKAGDLLLFLLKDEEIGDKLISKLLEHDSDELERFSAGFSFEFGPSGGVQLVNKPVTINIEQRFEDFSDALFDLARRDEFLSLKLLNYLLKWLSELNNKKGASRGHLLESDEDLMEVLYRQLTARKLLLKLVNASSVQKALMNSPEELLAFIKSLFPASFDEEEADDNAEILYASLMLIKVMITEGEPPKDWRPFDELADFLREKIGTAKPSMALLGLITEVLEAIRMHGKAARYRDLNANKDSEFTKALRDLADPLLPVRAHGLMTLTKLIESSEPEVLAKKDLVLTLFQENLKDDDSFVYLTAINGLCAMALSFPGQVIEILVQEFIDMPRRNVGGEEIAPENRAKLGEILVKTTRALGEMAPAYKNILINGFLCAIRDADELVRASSLSCLGELCKVLGFRLGNTIIEILYCIGRIIETDKALECRRAAVLVTTLLIRGLGKDVLTDLGNDLLPVYRGLKYLRDNDNDEVLRLHAQLALEELDEIVQNILFAKPVLQKNIFLLP